MSKKAKILILLIFLSFSAIFLLIISSKPVIIDKNLKNKQNNKVDLAKLEVNYKNDVKKILFEYEQSIGTSSESDLDLSNNNESQTSSTTEKSIKPKDETLMKLAEIKKDLLDLTVPPVSALMDLHVSLVLALSKMESNLSSDNLEEYKKSAESIKIAKNKNQWLNQ